MALVGGVRSVLKRAACLAPVRALQKRQYDRVFEGDSYGCFKGVYRSFAEAAEAAPGTKRFGFDLPEFGNADIFKERMTRIFAYDYPILFWLKSLLARGTTVFDVGGNVGIHFYAYARHLAYPPGLRWIVCDVPEVVAVGAEIATRNGAEDLAFTTTFADAAKADILLSAGTLQYVESPPFSVSLVGLTRRPAHLLLNKLPLYDGEPFVTLENGGVHFVAEHIFNRRTFIDSIESVGYRLVDAWEDPAHSCRIPFHPDRSVPFYSGLYFRAET
jgi:putative methyltransferase (TIGR04325 family)